MRAKLEEHLYWLLCHNSGVSMVGVSLLPDQHRITAGCDQMPWSHLQSLQSVSYCSVWCIILCLHQQSSKKSLLITQWQIWETVSSLLPFSVLFSRLCIGKERDTLIVLFINKSITSSWWIRRIKFSIFHNIIQLLSLNIL